jgi:MFS family permease
LTNLRNRAFWLSLPETISAVPTLYLGTIVAQAFLDHSTWRWGYGMWAIVTPVVALPLLLTLFIRKIKDRKQYPADVLRPRVLRDIRADDPLHVKAYQLLWIELDAPGCFLLIAGLALILIPVSLTGARNSGAWENNGGFIAMVVIGAILFVAFIVWDYFFAKKPFIPFRLIKDRTIIAACTLCILDFMHYSLFSVFFPSYLQVAGHFSPGHATRIE